MPANPRPAPSSRRRFLRGAGTASLALLAGCKRLPFQPSQASASPRVGFVSPSPADTAQQYLDAFRQGLRQLGWVEGQNVEIDYRFAEGRDERLGELTSELVALNLRVLVTEGEPATHAAQRVAGSLPIVFGVAADPVGTGLVASIPHPGGNVTGLTTLSPELAGKRLELLKEIVPTVSRVAVLWNASNADKAREFAETEAAAQTLGIRAQSLAVRRSEEMDGALALAAQEAAGALTVLGDPLTVNERASIANWAARNRLPAIYPLRLFVDAGGLMNYGPSITAMFRRAAYYVDRILKGAKPADLPVEQPMTFDLVINLKAAQALGLAIPQHVLLQATEVLQ
jgi:putative tryptophan/tyrosine transport system substrate-binding protein